MFQHEKHTQNCWADFPSKPPQPLIRSCIEPLFQKNKQLFLSQTPEQCFLVINTPFTPSHSCCLRAVLMFHERRTGCVRPVMTPPRGARGRRANFTSKSEDQSGAPNRLAPAPPLQKPASNHSPALFEATVVRPSSRLLDVDINFKITISIKCYMFTRVLPLLDNCAKRHAKR